MSDNPKEFPRIEVEVSQHEMARALVEYLVKHRGWPTGVRYDNTVLTVGTPNVFSAEMGPLIPEPGDP